MIALLTSFTLVAAQVPIDETNTQSTIKVKKKAPKDSPPPPVKAEPVAESLAQVTTPPPPPVQAVRVAPPVQSIETAPPQKTKIVPWITLAASAVATGIGAFFAVRTGQKIDEQGELEFMINTSKSRVNVPDEFRENQKAVFINAITATVLISAGVSGAIASSVALSMD